MPRRDGTGPLGRGAMTGRGAGKGRGWRHWFYATGLPGWMRTGGLTDASLKPDLGQERQGLEETRSGH